MLEEATWNRESEGNLWEGLPSSSPRVHQNDFQSALYVNPSVFSPCPTGSGLIDSGSAEDLNTGRPA